MTKRIEAMATRAEEIGFAALRIVSGALFTLHGVQKMIIGWPPSDHAGPAAWSQLWFGGIIELVCGALVAVGFLTRPAAFLASGTMAVAYIQFHWKLAFADNKWLPGENGGELAVVYCFLFLFFVARGAGAASIDARLGRRS